MISPLYKVATMSVSSRTCCFVPRQSYFGLIKVSVSVIATVEAARTALVSTKSTTTTTTTIALKALVQIKHC